MWNSRKDYIMIWTLEWYVSASVTLMATGYACSLHGIPYIYVPLLTGQPCWIGQPCWTYSCSSLDTGPCSTLLDIPLLIPAGYTIAHTGTCSALLDIPLLSLCSVLLDTDRLSPARHIRSALMPEIGPCSAPLETTLHCSALLDALAQPCWKYYCSTLQVLAQPYWTQALAQPCWTQALTQPCWTQPCWFAQP